MPSYDVMIAQLFRLVSLYNPGRRFHVVNPDDAVLERFVFLPDSHREFQQATFSQFASTVESR